MHVRQAIRLVFANFRELGSGRQVFLWLRSAAIRMTFLLACSQIERSANDVIAAVEQDLDGAR